MTNLHPVSLIAKREMSDISNHASLIAIEEEEEKQDRGRCLITALGFAHFSHAIYSHLPHTLPTVQRLLHLWRQIPAHQNTKSTSVHELYKR